jgi:ribosome-binding factor A
MIPARVERLAQEFQQEIALIIQRELKDPHTEFVTITRVELSKDGRHAKVFYSCLGKAGDQQAAQVSLDRSRGFIYGLLKKRFRIKAIPELLFRFDPSIQANIDLADTFRKLNEPQPPPDGP